MNILGKKVLVKRGDLCGYSSDYCCRDHKCLAPFIDSDCNDMLFRCDDYIPYTESSERIIINAFDGLDV